MSGAGRSLSPAKRFIAVRVFPWVVVLFASFFIWIGIDQVRYATDSLEWPSVAGTVSHSGVESHSSRSGNAASTSYHARVVYRYVVDDADFEGERISYGAYGTGDAERAARIAARYPLGAAVRVYYQPGNPQESVLEPGGEGIPWFYLALGTVFASIGLLMARFMPRMFPPDGGGLT